MSNHGINLDIIRKRLEELKTQNKNFGKQDPYFDEASEGDYEIMMAFGDGYADAMNDREPTSSKIENDEIRKSYKEGFESGIAYKKHINI